MKKQGFEKLDKIAREAKVLWAEYLKAKKELDTQTRKALLKYKRAYDKKQNLWYDLYDKLQSM